MVLALGRTECAAVRYSAKILTWSCHFLSLANTCLPCCSTAVNLTLHCISQPADCISISKSPGWDHDCSFTFFHISFQYANSNFSASISLDARVGWVTPVTFNLLVPKLCALRWTASGRKNRHSCWKNTETFNAQNNLWNDWLNFLTVPVNPVLCFCHVIYFPAIYADFFSGIISRICW